VLGSFNTQRECWREGRQEDHRTIASRIAQAMELKLNDPGLDWRSHGIFVPRQECAAKRMRKAFIVSAVKTVDRYTRLLTADERGRE
jgi:hypothetical protein